METKIALSTIMNLPKVCIIIPVYNGADYLAEAIESALAQTYCNCEILVVNDGSTDGGATERIALSYGNKLRYFSKTNGGVASALNLAIKEMHGEYFSWLSHDDIYTPDKVFKQVQMLNELAEPEAVIYSDYSVFTNDPNKDYAICLPGVSAEQFRYWITVENCLHGCTLLVPRCAFDKVGIFNEALRTTQDYDLWFRIAKHFSFVHIPEKLVKARNHSDQGSHKMADIAFKECNELLANFIRQLEPNEIISATGKSLAESYAQIASSMFRRGFNEAGLLADEFSKQYDLKDKSRSNSLLSISTRYINARLYNIGRKCFPQKLKEFLKRMIN